MNRSEVEIEMDLFTFVTGSNHFRNKIKRQSSNQSQLIGQFERQWNISNEADSGDWIKYAVCFDRTH